MKDTPPATTLIVRSDAARQLSLNASLGLVGLCALWGLAQVAIKIGISPLLQAGLRSAGAAI